MVLVWTVLQRFVVVASDHITTKYDLKIESHNLATTRLIENGIRIYDRSVFEDLPFIITIYNPLYFLVVSALPQHTSNPFFTGRLVSLVSTSILLGLLFLPGRGRNSMRFWIPPVFAVLWLLSIPIFVESAVYFHPDMLALVFSASAVVSIHKSIDYHNVLWSSVFAVLAFATKQNFICGFGASFLFLLFADKRKLLFFSAVSAILLGTFFLITSQTMGNEYWFSTIGSVLRHPSFLSLTAQRLYELFQSPMCVLLVISLVFSVFYLKHELRGVLLENPYLLYCEFAALAPLVGLGKIGGEANYFLEFMLASLMWLVFFTRRFLSEFSALRRSVFVVAFLSAFLIDLMVTEPFRYLLLKHPNNQYFQSNFADKLNAEMRSLNPRDNNFLVLNSHVLSPFLSNPHFNDPYNYWLMWNYGIMNPEPMIHAIERKYFSLIIYISAQNPCHIPSMDPVPITPQSAAVLQAVQNNYVPVKGGVVFYFLPAPSD